MRSQVHRRTGRKHSCRSSAQSSRKIKEKYKGYVVHLLVASRSKVGYDSSGREQASPDAVQLTTDILLKLLDLQLLRVKNGMTLVTSLNIMLALDDLVKHKNLQTDWKDSERILPAYL